MKAYILRFVVLLSLLTLLVSCNQSPSNINSETTETHGLYAEYFASEDFTGLVRPQIDSQINFSWGDASPAFNFPEGTFSARWTGLLIVEESGDYSFTLKSSGQASLDVNNQKVSSDQNLNLNKGTYPLKLEFTKTNPEASLSLSWTSTALKQQRNEALDLSHANPNLIPQSKFIPSVSLETTNSSANLIKNAGFESGLGNWKVTNNPDNAYVSNEGYQSDKALKTSNYAWVQQDIPASSVIAGTTYTLFANGKAENECTVALWGGKANGTVLFNKKLSFTQNTWKERAATLTLPNDVTWAAVYINPSEQNCLIDNLSLSIEDHNPAPNPEPRDNLVLNGSFSNNLNNWKTTAGTSKVIEENNNSTLFTDDLAWVQQDINYKLLEPNQTYRIQAKAKTPYKCRVGVWGGSQGKQLFKKELNFDEGNFNTKYLDITLPDSTIWATVYIASPSDCWVDNVEFVKVEKDPPPPELDFRKTIITPSDAQNGDYILSVDLSENTIVLVRAQGFKERNAVFTFDYDSTGWTETQKINAEASPEPDEVFIGFENVTLNKDTMVLHLEERVQIDPRRYAISDLITYTRNGNNWQQIDRFEASIRGTLKPLLIGNTLFQLINRAGDPFALSSISAYDRDGQGWVFSHAITRQDDFPYSFDAIEDTLIYSSSPSNLDLWGKRNNVWTKTEDLGAETINFAISQNLLVFVENENLITYSRVSNEAAWKRTNSFPIEANEVQVQLDNNQLATFTNDASISGQENSGLLRVYQWGNNSWSEQKRLDFNHPNALTLEDFEDGRIILKDNIPRLERANVIERVYIFE